MVSRHSSIAVIFMMIESVLNLLDSDDWFYLNIFSSYAIPIFGPLPISLMNIGRVKKCVNSFMGGCTSMYDGIFKMLKAINAFAEHCDHIETLVITDGHDNASLHKKEEVQKLFRENLRSNFRTSIIGYGDFDDEYARDLFEKIDFKSGNVIYHQSPLRKESCDELLVKSLKKFEQELITRIQPILSERNRLKCLIICEIIKKDAGALPASLLKIVYSYI
jgi:hypothetical protein